jgi:phage/plasmid-associated DNA primase
MAFLSSLAARLCRRGLFQRYRDPLLQFCGRTAILPDKRQERGAFMVGEVEFEEMAETYREMAEQSRNPLWKMEFRDRAERYDVALAAARRKSLREQHR